VRKLVLGEKLWEEKGKVTGMSFKSMGPEGVHLEQTFASEVKGLGKFPSGTNMATLDMVQAPDGSFSGSGLGVFMTKDGDIVMWKLYGFGALEAGQNKSFAIAKFWTASPKIAWMNSSIVAIEGIADPKTTELSVTGYEWK
jgi:hypothetical protein